MNKKFCYNCGVELMPSKRANNISPYPDNGQTREHVPAKCLFLGINEIHAPNRITVSGCRKCNNNFSLDDEEIRNLIGILKDGKSNEEFLNNTFKSLSFKLNKEPKRFTYKDGELFSVGINCRMLFRAHEKHFRALFYHQYGLPLPDNYVVKAAKFRPEEEKGEEWKYFSDLLRNFEWQCSGHPDIFRYVIVPIKDNIKIESKVPFNGDEMLIISIFVYHNVYEVLVGATLER